MDALAHEPQPDTKPTKEFAYNCRCGHGMFIIDWVVYVNFKGHPRIKCAACDREQIVTEPASNGPH